MLNTNKNILIVGLGLMGGSYALGFRKLGFKVSAIARRQETIDYALENNIIDKGYITPDKEALNKADIIVFGLYPQVFIEWIKENQHNFKSGALLTDVTGVKGSVVYEVQAALRDDVEFIAAHPMAGKEVYGVENADERIFYGANYIVTPTEKNTPEAIEDCLEIGRLLGFGNVSILTPEKHDQMIGFVSQLTHCIAVTLMNCCDDENLKNYTGDSFRDLTRIARINDKMWSELFIMNKPALLHQMHRFEDQFDRLKAALLNGDEQTMREMMQISTARRALFDKK
ncbi:MAG: prephenate dehydrogenase [Clostridia bacterium]|nr:prephenate dehydrogenase [Clostridia bacterium]